MFSLANRVAFVTGGSRGIGKVLAQGIYFLINKVSLKINLLMKNQSPIGLARAGADIVVVSRSKDDIEATAKEIREETGRKAIGIACDVTNKQSITEAVKQAIGEFNHLDILINNAGIEIRKNTLTLTEEEWDAVVDTNFKSVFLVSQAVGSHMVRRKYG